MDWKRKIISFFIILLVSPTLVLFDLEQIAVGKYHDVKAQEKVVALTFDDGPDPRFTPLILEILKEYQSKATFFVVGKNVSAHPDILKKIISDGHEIENHTMSHPNLKRLPSKKVLIEIENCSKEIAKTTGVEPDYFRPPVGQANYNVHQITSSLNIEEIYWSICIENRAAPTSYLMAQRVLDRIKPGGIILLHDGRLDRTKTVNALPILLKGLEEKGYRTVTLKELMDQAEKNREHKQ